MRLNMTLFLVQLAEKSNISWISQSVLPHLAQLLLHKVHPGIVAINNNLFNRAVKRFQPSQSVSLIACPIVSGQDYGKPF